MAVNNPAVDADDFQVKGKHFEIKNNFEAWSESVEIEIMVNDIHNTFYDVWGNQISYGA